MPTMPNVVGLEWQAALGALSTAGVRTTPFGYFQVDPVAFKWQKSAAVKPNFVISQIPTSGTTGVVPNSAMTLTVSAPPVAVAYPGGGTNSDT